MINKRLIGTVPDSKPYIAGNVALQWLSLLSNAGMIFSCAWFLQQLLEGAAAPRTLALPLAAGLAAVLVRGICTAGAGRMSFLAARSVKRTLRRSIYEKLLRLGPAYSQNVATSEAVQLAAEGVEQLETYFGAYLPQFFYSMLAPATLFALLAPVSLRAALALLVCVPLIPAAIAAVQTFAKKLLGRYWGQYTALGDTFLENLQGLTTLKIYQADGYKQEEMNREAENFRRITMKVLTMQLNSITIMDLVAYGGAALGMVLAVLEFRAGRIPFWGCFAVIFLSADFFLPMRQLGSFFHIAMNGMAASDKIFTLLDLPEGSYTDLAASLSAMMVQSYGVAIVKPAEGKTQEVVDAMDAYIQNQQQTMEHYLEDQYQIAASAKVATVPTGEVVMVCCENSDAVMNAIKTALDPRRILNDKKSYLWGEEHEETF